MVFVQGWDESNPAGSRSISLGDNDIRDFKYAIRERLQEDHNFFASEAGQSNIGLHKKASFINQSNPTNFADMLILFAKDAGGKTELHSVHEDAITSQLTYLGKLWVSALKIASETNKDLIRHNGTIWTRFSWTSFLAELQTDLNFGGSKNSWSNLLVIRLDSNRVQVTADEIVLTNASNQKLSAYTVSVIGNITVSGANGLDTGAEASNTWYAVWVISNGSTTSALLSTSFTAPTMPAGYTYKALVGSVRNNSSGDFVDFTSNGAWYTFKAGQLVATGDLGPGVWTPLAMAAFVPSAISTMAFGTIATNARAGISNLNTGIATQTPDANKIAPSTGSHGTIYWRLSIFTADTLYAFSDNAEARWWCDGFYMNKL